MTHIYNTSIAQAINDINPSAEYFIENESYDNINWINTSPISKDDIVAKQIELDVRDAHIAPRNEKFTYSFRIEKQLDSLWHDIDDDKFGADAKTGSFYLEIKAIKDANPKA